MTLPTLVVPIKDFDGMTRLSEVLRPSDRRSLSVRLAERLVASARGADLDIVVVSSDPGVIAWGTAAGVVVVDDPGGGLSAASARGVSSLGDKPWMLIHADLPLVNAGALMNVIDINGTVLVPSMDGGTNVIAHRGAFPFAFGDGSFHRHLAAVPTATVLPTVQLSIEIDTPEHLGALDGAGPTPSLTAS